MPRLKRMSGKQVISRLKELGFQPVRQRGSHVVLARSSSEGKVGCVVPLHRELALWTLLGIIKQAKLTRDEFAGE